MSRAWFSLRPVFLLVFILTLVSAFPEPANADNLTWSRFDIPSNGISGKWVLAEGSDVRYPTLAIDGTLYCYANPTGTPYRLFKSTDGGYTWSYTGRVTDTISDIAIIPDNPLGIYYATASGVYRYIDDDNFMCIADSPGGAGTGNIEITSLDVSSVNGNPVIVVGTRDIDASQYGGVYILDESQSPDWIDTGIGDFDVYDADFSPHFASDNQIVAVTTDEQDTIITTRINNTSWNSSIGDAWIEGLTPVSASIAFPADYDSNVNLGKYTQFIAIDTGSGQGDVYRLEGLAAPSASKVTDLNAGSGDGLNNVDIASLALSGDAGNANLLAGSAETTQTYFSEDAGKHWKASNKPASGDSNAFVLIAPDYATSGVAYAGTSGAESAFSISRDKGVTWNQTGLIDTGIMTILDLAVSPYYNKDNRLFLLTADIQDSLWYSANGGLTWERIYCSIPANSERINLVLLSSRYAMNNKVFLAGTRHSIPFIWESEDNGRTFTETPSIDPVTQSPVNIDTWAIAPGDILFTGSFDGNDGLVYQTDSNGLTYVDKAVAGHQPLNSLVISPDYTQDKTLLAGNTNGSVFYSCNNGLIFEPLPPDIEKAPFSGAVSLAFDPNYSQNKTVYAASDSPDLGLFRFEVDKSIAWDSIDNSLPAGAKIGQIVTSASGQLYSINLQNTNNTLMEGGMERSLNPCGSTGPSFETIISGLEDGKVLKKLWIQGNNLWTVDTTSNKLLVYTDTLATPVILTSPANNTPNQDTRDTSISWEALQGATEYHWQVDTDNNFLSIPKGLEGDTDSTLVKLTTLSSDTTYFWRVKATSPSASPWSETRSFNTNSTNTIAAPRLTDPKSTSPASIGPIFKWSACEYAQRYELLLSRFDDFSVLIISKTGGNACSSNVWKCESALAYGTSYYWKVRAISDSTTGPWSDVSIFTTESAPTPTPSPTSKPSPSPNPVQSGGNTGGTGGLTDPTATAPPESTATTPANSVETPPSPQISTTPAIEPQTYATAAATPANKSVPITPSAQGPPTPSTTVEPTPQTRSIDRTDSTIQLIFFLMGGLVVLTGILIFVVIFVLKKFKRY